MAQAQLYSNDEDFTWIRPQKAGIKTVTKTSNGKVVLLQEYDKRGNVYFIKNDGLNGDDITAIWGIEYNSSGRNIKVIFAHSNVGFDVVEIEYAPGLRKQFAYTSDTVEVNDANDTVVVIGSIVYNPYTFISSINSKRELEQLQQVKEVFRHKRYLQQVVRLDNQNRPVEEWLFDHTSDTTLYSRTIYRTGSSTEEVTFLKDRMIDDFTDHKFYDNRGNKIKSYRIFKSSSGDSDTTDVKEFTYNAANQLTEERELEKGKADRQTTFAYKGGKLIRKEFSEAGRPDQKQVWLYEYNKKGELVKEESYDQKGSKRELVNSYHTAYTYW